LYTYLVKKTFWNSYAQPVDKSVLPVDKFYNTSINILKLKKYLVANKWSKKKYQQYAIFPQS